MCNLRRLRIIQAGLSCSEFDGEVPKKRTSDLAKGGRPSPHKLRYRGKRLTESRCVFGRTSIPD